MNFYPYNHPGVVLTEGDLCVIRTDMGHLCGYCALDPNEIPKEWHGDYDADALQYLQIHGGLTYCDVKGVDEAARKAAITAARESIPRVPEGASLDERMDYYKRRDAAADEAAKATPYTHVVFGFDCAHAGDEGNYALREPKHVLELCRQMRQQLVAYAKVINEWREAGRETRSEMIEQIRHLAGIKTDFGFGAMVGMLAGAPEFGADSRQH